MVSYGFFNSSNGDRKYTSEQISMIIDYLINDGILETYGDKFFTTPATNNLGVILGTGWAWFNYTWTQSDTPIPFQLTQSDPSLDRIDTIFLRVDHRSLNRMNDIGVLEGTASLNAKPRELPTVTDVYYHPLAYVRIRANATRVAASDIEILVGKTNAPFITSILQTTDITTLFQGWSEQFGNKMTFWQNSFDDKMEEWEEEIDVLETSLTANVNALITQGNTQLSTQQSTFNGKLTTWQNSVNTVVNNGTTQLSTQQTQFNTKMTAWQSGYDDKLSEWEDEIDTLETSLTSNVSALITQGNTQLSTQQTQFNTQLSNQQTSFNTQLSSQQTTFNNKISSFQTTFNTSLSGWEADFTEWFEHLQTYLSEDVVTNLANEIEKRVLISDKASVAQAQAGTDDTKWMTPSKAWSLITAKIATDAEAKAGTSNVKLMTPLRTDAYFSSMKATSEEVTAGENDTHWISPAKAKAIKGKRTARFTVGAKSAGWTADQVDYLYENYGNADEIINAAIQALPTNGGEIVLLDGTYYLKSNIIINKANVTLSGNGANTILERRYNDPATQGLIRVTANNVTIRNLKIYGMAAYYNSENNKGIYISENCENIVIAENIFDNNPYGLYVNSVSNVIVANNTFLRGTMIPTDYACYFANSNGDTIIGNYFKNNNYGIRFDSSGKSAILGNSIITVSHGIYLQQTSYMAVTGNVLYDYLSAAIQIESGNRNTITGNSCLKESPSSSSQSIQVVGNYNLITGNNIMGRNYTDAGTGNTYANNKYN